MSVPIVLGSSAVLLLLCFLVRRYGRFLYLTSKVPGPSLWEFVFGHARQLLSDNLVYHVHKISMAYKHRPWGMWSMRGFVVVVSDCDSIGEVFKSKNLQSKPSFFYGQIVPFSGGSLLTLNGKELKRHHKFLAPVFRKTSVDTHLHKINIIAKQSTEKMGQVANGEDVDARKIMLECIAAMSVDFFDEDISPPDEYIKLLGTVEDVMADIAVECTNPVYFYLWHRFTPTGRARANKTRWGLKLRDRKFHEVKEELVARCRAQSAAPEKRKTTCVLDVLMTEYLNTGGGGKFDEDLLAAGTTIMVAAQDTTTFIINMCLVLIALHPEVQRRICEEIDDIFGGSLRPVEHEDLAQMKYLEMAIKEALRLFPAAPMIGRKAEEDVVLGGVTVPKGCTVLINLFALHRNPELFKDPLKYDPFRFSPEISQGRNSYAYLPFSAGFRNCPGQVLAWLMLKTTLCYMFREFQVLPGSGVNTMDDVKPQMTFTFHCPKLPLRFVRRTK